jgi:hypothetical protein
MMALMIPKITDPITLKMIRAGMVATAHLTMRTTIDLKGIYVQMPRFNPTWIENRV